MSNIKQTSLWIDSNGTPPAIKINRKRIKVWNKRLELFFGFIPAFLVWFITYGKKFR